MKNVRSRLPNVFLNREEEPSEWQDHLQSVQKERKIARSDAYDLGMIGAKTLPLLESKLGAFLDRTKTSVKTNLEITCKTLSTQLENIEREIDDNPLGSQISKSYHGDRFPVKDFALSLLESGIERREQRLAVQKLAEREACEKFENFKSSLPTSSVGFWSTPIGQLLLALSVIIGEMLILIPLLEAAGVWGNSLEIYLFSAVLVCLLTVSTHITAQFLADRKMLLASLSVSAGLLLISALALIRWDDTNSLIYLMINVSFFLMGTLVAYHAHKISPYVELTRQKSAFGKRVAKTTRSISRLRGLREGILKVSQRRAVRRGLRQNEELSRKKLAINEKRAKVEAKFQNLDAFFDSLRTEIGYEFRLSYTSAKRQRWLTIILLIVIGFFLTNCQSPIKDEYRDILLVFDASRSNSSSPPSPEAVFQKVDEILQLGKRRNGRYGVNIYLGSLGESKIPQIKKIVLAPGEPYIVRTEKKRQAEIKAFGDSVKSAIQQILTKKPNDRLTRANAGLCSFINSIVQSTSDENVQRNVIILSDLVEASSVYRFPSSTYNASFVDNNYDKIAKLMKKDCQMPNLENVSFEICHQPPIQLEDQFLAATAFWKAYLLKHKASDVKISGGI